MAWLYKQKGSANWWIGYRVNGRQVLRSTGTPDREKAEKELGKIEQLSTAKRNGNLTEEFYRALIGAETTLVSLKMATNQWLEACNGTVAASSLRRYRYTVDDFLEFYNATDKKPLLTEITQNEVRAFLANMHGKQSVSSTNQARKILSIFFRFTLDNGHVRVNPVKLVKGYKAAKKHDEVERRPFTPDELKATFMAAPDDFWRFMCHGGLYTGLRLGDLACLRRMEIVLHENKLHLEATKTRTELQIPLAAPFRSIIEARLAVLGRGKPNEFLWPEQAAIYIKNGSSQLSNKFYDRVLVPAGLAPRRMHRKKEDRKDERRQQNEVSFHSFRHSFVSLLKISGASQHVAKELAGHSSDAVSSIYTTIPIEVLSKAIQALPEVTP